MLDLVTKIYGQEVQVQGTWLALEPCYNISKSQGKWRMFNMAGFEAAMAKNNWKCIYPWGNHGVRKTDKLYKVMLAQWLKIHNLSNNKLKTWIWAWDSGKFERAESFIVDTVASFETARVDSTA